jgi:hypothetical protein
MNTLKYITIDRVTKEDLPDGTVIVADPAIIEALFRDPRVKLAEQQAQSPDWQRVWGDGVYHYELLVARRGTTTVLDANGDYCGFRVNGTELGIEA